MIWRDYIILNHIIISLIYDSSGVDHKTPQGCVWSDNLASDNFTTLQAINQGGWTNYILDKFCFKTVDFSKDT